MEKLLLIEDKFINNAPNVVSKNFTYFSKGDLHYLFELYDEIIFENKLSKILGSNIDFSVSGKLKKVAGKTIFYGSGKIEIRISSFLLLNTFTKTDETKTVSGIVCKNRLNALMRIFEHELIHVIEYLDKGNSNCSKQNFKMLAYNFFGHTHHKHKLIEHEKNVNKNDFYKGQIISFAYKNQNFEGKIINITKRATVLVKHPKGNFFDKDFGKCTKFYVPLQYLKDINS